MIEGEGEEALTTVQDVDLEEGLTRRDGEERAPTGPPIGELHLADLGRPCGVERSDDQAILSRAGERHPARLPERQDERRFDHRRVDVGPETSATAGVESDRRLPPGVEGDLRHRRRVESAGEDERHLDVLVSLWLLGLRRSRGALARRRGRRGSCRRSRTGAGEREAEAQGSEMKRGRGSRHRRLQRWIEHRSEGPEVGD